MAITNAQIISQYKQAHGLPLSYPLFTDFPAGSKGMNFKRI